MGVSATLRFFGERRANGGEERRERLGAMVDMRRQLGPARARLVLRPRRAAVDEHRGHADGVRGLQIVRQVVEHRGARRRNAVCRDEAVIGFARRLRMDVVECVDVEDILETVEQSKPRRHGLRVLARAVGEHELPPRQRVDGGPKLRRRRHRAEVDVVHVVEEGVGADIVKPHQAGQRRAVLGVVALPQLMRLVQGKP